MPKRPSTAKKAERAGTPHDFTVTARRVVEQAIGEKLDGSPLDNPDSWEESRSRCSREAWRFQGRESARCQVVDSTPEADRERSRPREVGEALKRL